jgi:hypothetical protein
VRRRKKQSKEVVANANRAQQAQGQDVLFAELHMGMKALKPSARQKATR